MSRSGLPEVSVVVLNYNGISFLKDCFDSLLQSSYPNTRLYLYDNCSTDSSIAFMTSRYPTVSVIRGETNGGYSKAYNEAVERVGGKYIVLLNNDVKVDPGWIEPLVYTAENNPEVGALQSKLVWFNDPSRFEYAGSSGGMIDRFGFPFSRGRVFSDIEYDEGQYNDECEIFWACGAALFVRKDVFQQCGGLDEHFVHHMEEIDLCWRIYLHGFSVRVVPSSVVQHHGGATITDGSFSKMYWNHRNSIFMLLKNLETRNLFYYTGVHILLDYVACIRSLVTLRPKRAVAIVKAHLWIISHIKLILRGRSQVLAGRKVSDEEVFRRMYPLSVVYQYFIRRKRTYRQLINIY